jgi:hypothetical protein
MCVYVRASARKPAQSMSHARQLGQGDRAAMHFAWALDLDPRGSQRVARETAEYAQLTDEDIRAIQQLDDGEEQVEEQLDAGSDVDVDEDPGSPASPF